MSRKCCYCSYKYSDVIVNYIIALGVSENTCCEYVLLVLSFHVVEQLVPVFAALYTVILALSTWKQVQQRSPKENAA